MSRTRSHILFVDDEPNMLSSLQRAMRPLQQTWDMTFESNPRQALALVNSHPPDVVVSDLRMPGMSGIELIEQIRQQAPGHSEYILLTGNADLASAIDAINKTGVFRFLTKPCASGSLIDAIEAALATIKAVTERPGRMATAALSAMSPAVAVVDQTGKVAYCNDSAEDVLRTHKGIVIDRQGGISVTTAHAGKFKLAVKKAAEDVNTPPKFVTLSDPEDLEPLTAVIMPVGQQRAVVMFTVPGRFSPPSLDSLVELFGLTRVEATLAQTIASGGTVEDAALNCKVTLETARTYLKRIFQKMGVRRQVDLVQLILTTPATFVRSQSRAV
ncbi:response regulator [uncultured Roseibium sp.]|uniref:response regulator n=1 Tax=uncultured Roseibium sp. TaxID=1936171 RepID=UPI0025962251|nr:response regulator [uncultured Roseibium sp.]